MHVPLRQYRMEIIIKQATDRLTTVRSTVHNVKAKGNKVRDDSCLVILSVQMLVKATLQGAYDVVMMHLWQFAWWTHVYDCFLFR